MYCANCFAPQKDTQLCRNCLKPFEGNAPQYLQPVGTLKQQYMVGKVLGHGGFGATYLAFDTMLNNRVAIKEYFPEQCCTRKANGNIVAYSDERGFDFEAGKQRFIQEARVLANFRNQHVIRVINSFEAKGTAYYVMEYEDGQTLSHYLQEHKQMSFEQVYRMLLLLLEGLDDVHQNGYLHQDIKPANIYLSNKGLPILLDFGSALSIKDANSQSRILMVSNGYSPIENYEHGHFGPWSDIYSLAASAYRALTGQNPPSAEDLNNKSARMLPLSQLCDLTQEEEAWLLRGLEIRPENRPQSVRAWLQMKKNFMPPDQVLDDNQKNVFVRMVIMPKLNDRFLSKAEEAEIYRAGTELGLEGHIIRQWIEECLVQTGSALEREKSQKKKTRSLLVLTLSAVSLFCGILFWIVYGANGKPEPEPMPSVVVSPSIQSSNLLATKSSPSPKVSKAQPCANLPPEKELECQKKLDETELNESKASSWDGQSIETSRSNVAARPAPATVYRGNRNYIRHRSSNSTGYVHRPRYLGSTRAKPSGNYQAVPMRPKQRITDALRSD